jgi:hypothetical protein
MDSISGLELSRLFYGELVRPWLAGAFTDVRHAAALIGGGSELLGFDDAMSRDHDWGPRLQIFVSDADFTRHAPAIVAAFAKVVPTTFLGAATKVRDGAPHGLEVWTLETWLRRQLAIGPDEPRDNLAWLGLAE